MERRSHVRNLTGLAFFSVLVAVAGHASAEGSTSASPDALSTQPGPVVSNSNESTHATSNPGQTTEETSDDTTRETSRTTSEASGSESTAPDEETDETNNDSGSNQADSDGSTVGSLVLSGTILSTVGVGITIGVAVATQTNKSAALELYLRQNAVAFQSDVSTGAGSVIADLAAFFGIAPDNRDEFAKILRELYPDLRPLVDQMGEQPDAAERFIRRVIDAMRQSPELRADLLDSGFLEMTLQPLGDPPSQG